MKAPADKRRGLSVSQEKLLLCEDLHVVLVHEGGTGETGSFELTQLFAELLALGQDGDFVVVAQSGGFGEDGGEICLLAVEQGDLLLGTGDLIPLFQQDAADDKPGLAPSSCGSPCRGWRRKTCAPAPDSSHTGQRQRCRA